MGVYPRRVNPPPAHTVFQARTAPQRLFLLRKTLLY
jgi:hypothetical protein